MVKTDQTERPSLSVGDSVYYRHPETGHAHHGVVAAIGDHGFLADADGGDEHKVTWDKFLGHRKRAERSATVVDRGEDGFIMEDDAGRRFFVRGSADDVLESGTIEKSQPVESPDHALLLKAQIVREMAAAGFEPMMDYVRDTFGENFVYREQVAQVDVSVPVRDALERLSSSLATQFQGLSAAISLLADRVTANDSMQQSLIAALSEARKPQAVTVTLPDAFGKSDAPVIHIDNHMPEQPAPVVQVSVPELPAPVVSVSPEIHVSVPEQPAPIVNIEVPAREFVTDIERNRDGDIVRTVQREKTSQ